MKNIFFIVCLNIAYSQTTNLDSLYYTYDEIVDSLFKWQDDFGLSNVHEWYGSIVYKLDSIGVSSNEELPIYAVKLSQNADLEEDKPRILILGQCHAEEIYGVEMSMSLIRWFLYPQETNWGYNELPLFLDNLEIWIVPTHNPEGLNVVHGFEDDSGNWQQDISFRKNKTDVDNNGYFNYSSFYPSQIAGNDSDGVDLNRNYGLNWFLGDVKYELNLQSCPSNQNYSSNYDYYKGTNPFSESEVNTIRDLVLSKQFLFSVAYHSSRSGCISERVIYPWSWEWVDSNGSGNFEIMEANKTSPDFQLIHSLANNIASRIRREEGGYYNPRPQKSRNGNAHDWIYAETGCIQFLIEMGTDNIQPDSKELIEATIENNREGLFYLFQEAIPSESQDIQHIIGVVTDFSTGNPIENVNFLVPEFHSKVLKPRKTDSQGRYHRTLPLGEYSIEFTAQGYQSQLAEIGQEGILNIELLPIEDRIVTLFIENYDDLSGSISIDLTTSSGYLSSFEITEQNTTITLYDQGYNLIAYGESMIPYHAIIPADLDTLKLSPENKDSEPENLINNSNWILEGDWIIKEDRLVSQNDERYENDSYYYTRLENILQVDQDKEISIEINLAYELEWEKDTAYLNIISPDTTMQIAYWTDQRWEFHTEYYFTNLQANVPYTIELGIHSDATLNYRGIEIYDLYVYTIPLLSVNNDYIGHQLNSLYQNYPNPFNPQTMVSFYLPNSDRVSLTIFDINGRLLYSVIKNKYYNAGFHEYPIKLNNLHIASGIYFYRLETNGWHDVKKMFVLK